MTATITPLDRLLAHSQVRVDHDDRLGYGRCEWACGRTAHLWRVTGDPRSDADLPVECVEVCSYCLGTAVAEAVEQVSAHGRVTVEQGPVPALCGRCRFALPEHRDDTCATTCRFCEWPGGHAPSCPAAGS